MSEARWAWFNRESPRTGHTVSILALVETVIASIAVALIALRFGTVHLTISACIAPFLLLRTEQSTAIGLTIANRAAKVPEAMMDVANEAEDPALRKLFGFAILPVWALVIGILALVTRVAATLFAVCLHPLASLRAIPVNWWRFVAMIDVTTNVEAVPGVTEHEVEHYTGVFDTSTVYDDIFEERNGLVVWIPISFVFLLYSLFVFLPAFIYRLSVKSTSLIYSPLIYVVHSAFDRGAVDMLRGIKDLAFHRVMRIYAAFVLLVFACKLYLFVSWSQLATRWNAIPSVDLVNAYVVPEEIPPWHIASVVNAALTWIIYFFADFVLFRKASDQTLPLEKSYVSNVLRTLWVTRGMLSLYTVACVAYITVALLPTVDWPPLGRYFFPWSR